MDAVFQLCDLPDTANTSLLLWNPSFPSLVAEMVKNSPALQETRVWSLDREDPPEKGMVTHSSILAWRISWTEEASRLQSMGLQRVGHDWATNTYVFHNPDSSVFSLFYSYPSDSAVILTWMFPKYLFSTLLWPIAVPISGVTSTAASLKPNFLLIPSSLFLLMTSLQRYHHPSFWVCHYSKLLSFSPLFSIS